VYLLSERVEGMICLHNQEKDLLKTLTFERQFVGRV
jgi:hypothetical protein